MEMVGACMQQPQDSLIRRALRCTPSGTKKQRAAKGDLEEDSGEGPERKRSLPGPYRLALRAYSLRSLLRNGPPNCSGPTKMDSSSTASSARRL
ncbi:hypothetical protein ElyMa_001070400 [Elysia marginata]|uniref:Uncharacterized protein n=1 Tax=Elysia marginata TaxID=1093978 RepID=A0AAV4HTP6_9GAST|nr:hypothetical protein ElyMa_001070400 [Elysia marginata]